jgi:hypothetical protein
MYHHHGKHLHPAQAVRAILQITNSIFAVMLNKEEHGIVSIRQVEGLRGTTNTEYGRSFADNK